MNRIFGYCRCSTNESKQDIDRQKRELFKLGVTSEEDIYCEYESGTNNKRVEFNKLLNLVEPTDTICCTEVSRLTRSTQYLCEILKIVQERNLRLIIDSFVVDCRTDNIDPLTKGMLMMWGVFAEMERDIISSRVKSGMENAKAKGKHVGRPKTNSENIPSGFWKYYPKYNKSEINVTEFAKLSGLSRKSIYKYIKFVEEPLTEEGLQ